MPAKPRYYVRTYDANLGRYTPQPGVRQGPYSLFGLRRALRKLMAGGYPCDYSSRCAVTGDPGVLVTNYKPESERT